MGMVSTNHTNHTTTTPTTRMKGADANADADNDGWDEALLPALRKGKPLERS